jgi:hypothetical protein
MTEKKQNNNGIIPLVIIKRLENELSGLEFGGCSLIVNVRDKHLTFRIEKTISMAMAKEAKSE